MNWEEQYQELLSEIVTAGVERGDRTGTGTRALFGQKISTDLRAGFPLLTLRKLSFNNVEAEALWYLRGEEHLDFLHERGATFWDPWAQQDGRTVGPVYGVQWRRWPIPARAGAVQGARTDLAITDQVAEAVATAKANPESRRMVVSAWNVADLPRMALPPCPFAWQLHGGRGTLSMTVYQRSADMVVGFPHDIAVHALLLTMICEVVGVIPATLTFMLGDAHVYLNHLDAVRVLTSRNHKGAPYLEPYAHLNCECGGCSRADKSDIDEFEPGDFVLHGYDPHPGFKVEVAV